MSEVIDYYVVVVWLVVGNESDDYQHLSAAVFVVFYMIDGYYEHF